jgi:hypothetical protein
VIRVCNHLTNRFYASSSSLNGISWRYCIARAHFCVISCVYLRRTKSFCRRAWASYHGIHRERESLHLRSKHPLPHGARRNTHDIRATHAAYHCECRMLGTRLECFTLCECCFSMMRSSIHTANRNLSAMGARILIPLAKRSELKPRKCLILLWQGLMLHESLWRVHKHELINWYSAVYNDLIWLFCLFKLRILVKLV